MGWVKEIGWGLALNDRDPDNPYAMNEAEMLLESCRKDLAAVKELQSSNDRSLRDAESRIGTYRGRVASAQNALEVADSIGNNLEEAMSVQGAASKQIQKDVADLHTQGTGLEKMHQSMLDASAEGVTALRIA
jgi:predicted  nucleic acid-binding Zn-ribbon protein